jgi:quinoprotein relay system zinc metallohydrolase 1
MSRRWLGLALLGGLLGAAVLAQPLPGTPHRPRPDAAALHYDLQPRALAPGVWVFEGAVDDFSRANGCNIINTALITTGAGAVVVNTGPSYRYGQQQREWVGRLTNEPVVLVLNLNLHPDYFFGNQAWAGAPVQALAGSMAGMRAEGPAYADNLYRLCGDWMKGTESTPPTVAVAPRRWRLGTRDLELRRLQGHTDDDLVLIDHTAGMLYAGGLVFAERAPTTPHAHFERWIAALDEIRQWHGQGVFRVVVPSHGPVHTGLQGVQQTQAWLRWAHTQMQAQAQRGLDLTEVLSEPIPEAFRLWAAQPQEWHRTLTQWYPVYERQTLQRVPSR